MPASSTISFTTTLWEGKTYGYTTYRMYTRNITISKLPRTLLDNLGEYEDHKELQFAGIYFLTNSSVDDPRIYVGQAGERTTGSGLLTRIREHNLKKKFWDTAYLIAPTDDSWEATELKYLEHTFYRLALEANSYTLENGNVPSSGKIAREKKIGLQHLATEILLMLRASGHQMFGYPSESKTTQSKRPDSEPISPVEVTMDSSAVDTPTDSIEADSPQIPDVFTHAVFCIEHKGLKHPARARLVSISDNHVEIEVFDGEILGLKEPRQYTPRYLRERELLKIARDEQISAGHIEGLKITRPIKFASPSTASTFVLGYSSNGKRDWVLESDRSISLGVFLEDFEGSQG